MCVYACTYVNTHTHTNARLPAFTVAHKRRRLWQEKLSYSLIVSLTLFPFHAVWTGTAEKDCEPAALLQQ